MAAAGGAHWSSRFAFLMASVGFAVGLGNIWRFPYVTGENGGAAFVLVYLACAFGIGVPILIAELLIGRRGQGSNTPVGPKYRTAAGRTAAGPGLQNNAFQNLPITFSNLLMSSPWTSSDWIQSTGARHPSQQGGTPCIQELDHGEENCQLVKKAKLSSRGQVGC